MGVDSDTSWPHAPKLCSCAGVSFSCSKCRGWGYLANYDRGETGKHFPMWFKNPLYRRYLGRRSHRITDVCPLCQFVIKGKVKRHLRIAHGRQYQPPMVTAEGGLTRHPIRACCYCHAHVGVSKIDLHMAKHHRNEMRYTIFYKWARNRRMA